MPQLMPLYWILSSILVLLLFMMVMKIYGNYLFFMLESKESKKSYSKNLWYW